MPTISERSRYRLTVTFEGGEMRAVEAALQDLRHRGLTEFRFVSLIATQMLHPSQIAVLRVFQSGPDDQVWHMDEIGQRIIPEFAVATASPAASRLRALNLVRRMGESRYAITPEGRAYVID